MQYPFQVVGTMDILHDSTLYSRRFQSILTPLINDEVRTYIYESFPGAGVRVRDLLPAPAIISSL